MGNNQLKVLHSEIVGSSNGPSGEGTRRFGVFELDLRAGELRRQGHKVKLQEQPFRVLTQLLEKPGEVVTREELRNRLWPADTFVDFDHSLNAAIRRLRDALGDTADSPTFVETVARRGYRFLAPVSLGSVNGNGSGETLAIVSPPVSPSIPRHRWWIITSIVGLVLVILGLVLGFFLAPHQPAPARVTRLTANPVDDAVRAATISPDGRYLAFSDEGGFYLRFIDTGETHSLSLPPDLRPASLSWFPDSVHLIVAMIEGGRNSSLWELSTLGGVPRRLLDDGRFPAISPDGKQLAFVAGKSMHQRIWLASVDGTQPRELAGEDGDFFGGIAWSPDGKEIAYTTAKFAYGHGVKARIDIAEVHGALSTNIVVRPTSVLSLSGLQGPLAWASDGRLIFSLTEQRPRQADSNLWSIRINRHVQPDGPQQRLTSDSGAVSSVSISGSGHRMTYLKGIPQPDVYVAALDSSGALSEPQRLTLDDRQDLPFDWTADGKQVIFISDRTGTFNIYKQAISEAVPEVLVGGNQNAAEPRLSPDGTQLIYVTYPEADDPSYEVPLMRVPLAGGTPQQIVKANWLSNHQCARAPASICVYSVVHDTDITFYRFDPFRGDPSQIYQIKDELAQLYNWSLSPDGTTLAMAKGKWGAEDVRIRLVSLVGSPERWIKVNGWPGLASLDWAADSKSLWAATVGDKENALLQIDLHGTVRPVWRPKKLTAGWAIPSRDGKKLALHVNSTSANVWMLDRP